MPAAMTGSRAVSFPPLVGDVHTYFSTLLSILIVSTGFVRVLASTLFREMSLFFMPNRGAGIFLWQIPLRPFNRKLCCGILFLFNKKKKEEEKSWVCSF